MAHTPGDWWLVELDAKLDDWTGARFVIRQPKHAPGGVAIIMGGLGEQEERDNAHLLKAAPKLLALARGYARFLETHPEELSGELLERVRATIAEAEGEPL